MNIGRFIFAQITDFIPRYVFDKFVSKYKGDFHVKDLTCYNQLLHLLFGQLTGCDFKPLRRYMSNLVLRQDSGKAINRQCLLFRMSVYVFRKMSTKLGKCLRI